MEYELRYNNLDCLPNQSLSVVQCGYQVCKNGYYSGLRVNDKYSFTFVISGKGSYCINDVRYNIKAGEGFFIPPSTPVSYSANEADPWQYVYAIVDGVGVAPLMESIGLSAKNVKFSFNIDQTKDVLFKMHESSRSYEGRGYDVLGWFLISMSKIEKTVGGEKTVLENNNQLAVALDFINRNYSKNITVKDVADYINFDRTYLYKLFQKHLNTSPIKYLNDFRLKQSLQLMEYDNLSLGEIALSVGFYDSSHYTHAFIKKYGIAPGAYRKNLKEKGKK